MGRLQERLQGLTAEVRGLRQKEATAAKTAASLSEQLGAAEGLASRSASEIHRLQGEVATLQALQQASLETEQALKAGWP